MNSYSSPQIPVPYPLNHTLSPWLSYSFLLLGTGTDTEIYSHEGVLVPNHTEILVVYFHFSLSQLTKLLLIKLSSPVLRIYSQILKNVNAHVYCKLEHSNHPDNPHSGQVTATEWDRHSPQGRGQGIRIPRYTVMWIYVCFRWIDRAQQLSAHLGWCHGGCELLQKMPEEYWLWRHLSTA